MGAPMPEEFKPSTARWLNRSVAFRAAEAELLAAHPVCQACESAPSTEAHYDGPAGCHGEPPYEPGLLRALCAPCHTVTPKPSGAPCPKPMVTPISGDHRWP